MTKLSELSPEESSLLAGLLYRAGIWLSYADDEHGETDDIREMKALEHIIESLAKLGDRSDFVREIAQETVSRRKDWPLWVQQSFDILPDCEVALALLQKKVNSRERKDYCYMLVHVAETVAAAYGEFGMEAENENILSGFLGKISDKLKGNTQKIDFMNISPAEQDAVENLRNALRMDE
ncbi:MAG: hypothetical protein CO093_07340 [Alphaproteobacteria bacterium CG_4_9_14_3_um_filter_47_13]|nr:MAG: hypothetical protein CO093_07340 [Alphaproteobacteria bacterium CG_4_9_14_3_um_filter_47_13]